MLLPFVVFFVPYVVKGIGLSGSISAYYYVNGTREAYKIAGPTTEKVSEWVPNSLYDGSSHDLFVGLLCAIAAFLVFHRGYSRLENWLLNGASALAFVIALSPMNWPRGQTVDGFHVWLGRAHLAAAGLFFALIALKTLLCAKVVRPDGAGALGHGGYGLFYKGIACVMFLPFGIIFLEEVLGVALFGDNNVFVAEVVGIVPFALYWIVRAYEAHVVSQQALAARPVDK